MADIAAVFHWSPEVMAAMPVDELFAWQRRAVDRFKIMNS